MAANIANGEADCLITSADYASEDEMFTPRGLDMEEICSEARTQMQSPMTYSEPALAGCEMACYSVHHCTMSDTALLCLDGNEGCLSSRNRFRSSTSNVRYKEKTRITPAVPGVSQSSFQRSQADNDLSRRKPSYSVKEVHERHAQVQKKYLPVRRCHRTDLVNFEGILNIIGGCSWWQVWVYSLVIMQQIPLAMFNINTVYMMYSPDHWCEVAAFNKSSDDDFKWSLEDALNTTLVYPRRSDGDLYGTHDQCRYYDRGEERYDELRRMTLAEASMAVRNESPSVVECTSWLFRQDVMKLTVVTEWNLVCNNSIFQVIARLFYLVGFLLGCIAGGITSDRFGRKPAVIGFGFFSTLFGLFLPFSTFYPMFVMVRFLSAFCSEAAAIAAYVLCMEITGLNYRAMINGLLQASWGVGCIVLALVAYICQSWQHAQLTVAAFHIGALLMVCTLPESPRWLLVSNRVEEAERRIRRACREPPLLFSLFRVRRPRLPSGLELVRQTEKRKLSRRKQRVSLLSVIISKELRMRTIFLALICAAIGLVDCGVILAFSEQSLPDTIPFTGNFFVNNALTGAIEFPTLLACAYFLNFGRKGSQVFTLIFASIVFVIAVTAVQKSDRSLALLLLVLGRMFTQGAFSILYVYTAELYPTIVRNTAVGMNLMVARLCSGIIAYIAFLYGAALASILIVLFSALPLFASLLVILLPETRNRPLPDTLQDAGSLLHSKINFLCCRRFAEDKSDKSALLSTSTLKNSFAANSSLTQKSELSSNVTNCSQKSSIENNNGSDRNKLTALHDLTL